MHRLILRRLIASVLCLGLGLANAAHALDAQFRFETKYKGKAQIVLLGVPTSQISAALETRNGRRMIPEYMSTYVDYKNQTFMNLVLLEDDNRGWGFEWGNTKSQLKAYFIKKRDEGYCATNLGVYPKNGEILYAMVLKTQENCKRQSLHWLRGPDALSKAVDTDFQSDYRMVTVSAFAEKNALYGAAITQVPKVATSYDLWDDLTRLRVRHASVSKPENGYTRLLKDLSIVHNGHKWLYLASWQDRRGTGFGAQLWDATKASYTNRQLRDLVAKNGLKIMSVAGYVADGEVHSFRIMSIK